MKALLFTLQQSAQLSWTGSCFLTLHQNEPVFAFPFIRLAGAGTGWMSKTHFSDMLQATGLVERTRRSILGSVLTK